MEAQEPSDKSKPTLTPAEFSVRSFRVSACVVVGLSLGGLIGWLIDSAITSSPYAGIRIGMFVGGLLGCVVGSGAGWRGAVLVLCVVCGMFAGAFAGVALWNPDPNSFVMIIPTAIGVIAGGSVGVALAAVLYRVLFRARRPDNPT